MAHIKPSMKLDAACRNADTAISAAYDSRSREDFKSAAAKALGAALMANSENRSDLANEYGRKYSEMNKKSLGG